MEPLPENSIEAFFSEAEDQEKRNKALFEKNNILLHKVFVQNPDGVELLNKWRDSLMMIPTISPESTQFGAGIIEGEKTFIRNIITSIQSVENEL
jgi:hypothetical protein